MNLRLLPISLLLALAACSNATPADPPLAGAKIGGPFQLIDQDGKAITDKVFAGKYRIMYFGYTYCPDVCPTTAQTIGAAMRLLDKSDPAVSARVVPVFVTVDPERDTPAVVKQFVSAFYPRFVGLTGSPAAIDKIKTEYGVFASKGKTTPNGGYLVEHSNAAYLMDSNGNPLALLPTEQGAQATADEIKRWVKTNP
ncbi:SCO family protein [Sphingomonas pruni]|uniref:SCO family protein n=1 Tax=Sphingomonas pruni TaxID=40683 RepID=UPI00083032AC|nr:SCO family protein [Sphingomonas pruni]